MALTADYIQSLTGLAPELRAVLIEMLGSEVGSIALTKDESGAITGGTITRADGSTEDITVAAAGA